jgi:hypothetical protein
MISQVIFKIDKKLKDKAMQKAQAEGFPFAFVLKMATQAYVDNNLDVQLVARPKLNEKTRRELIKISKDIKQGKNLSPGFNNVEEAIAYLKSR